MRKRIRETEAYDSWLILSFLFGVGFVALAFVVVSLGVNEQSHKSAVLKTELVRVCDLVKEFAARSDRFPMTLDEVNFEAGKFSVQYFPDRASASIFLEDPGSVRDWCFIKDATPKLPSRSDQRLHELLKATRGNAFSSPIVCFPWDGCIFMLSEPPRLPSEAGAE